MADWVSIADASLDPDAPITSGLGYAWRDNPIAIAEGASGAPRVQMAAFPRLVAGSNIKYSNSYTGTNFSVDVRGNGVYGFVQFGDVRVNIGGSSAQRRIQRQRNGSLTSLYNATSTSDTVDISVRPGDAIIIDVLSIGSFTTDWSFRTNGVDIVPCSDAWFGFMDPNAAP